MQFRLLSCLTALAALASAQTPANVAQPPSGNPIGHPELGELIPAGQSYTITWSPDTGDRVTLKLLRGPSTNVVPILTIAENIPNTGSYIWASVPTTLEPDTTGYGIQLIVEGTGEYQYSPQCGVSNDAYMGSSSSSMTGSSTVTVVSATTSFVTYATGLAGVTGGNFSSPVLSPSKSMTVPSTLQSTFTGGANTRSASSTASVAIPESTGAAVANRVVGGMVGLVAGCAAVLAF